MTANLPTQVMRAVLPKKKKSYEGYICNMLLKIAFNSEFILTLIFWADFKIFGEKDISGE